MDVVRLRGDLQQPNFHEDWLSPNAQRHPRAHVASCSDYGQLRILPFTLFCRVVFEFRAALRQHCRQRRRVVGTASLRRACVAVARPNVARTNCIR